jgi:hypothetical protein
VLVDHVAAANRFEIRFRAELPDEMRLVSVLVPRGPGPSLVSFPHASSEAGQSLGSDELDRAVCERAASCVNFFEAASEFARWRENG